MDNTADSDPGLRPFNLLFSGADLAIARKAFVLIVNDNPARVMQLEPVLRWKEEAWLALNGALLESGFDRHRPAHLTALQWLIDQACDKGTKK